MQGNCRVLDVSLLVAVVCLGCTSGAGSGNGALHMDAGAAGRSVSSAARDSGAAGTASHRDAASEGGASASWDATPSFSNVWEHVLVPKGCTGVLCHGGSQGHLDMGLKEAAYKNLVGVSAAGMLCGASGKLRVAPGDPDASLLLDKISHAMPACGETMPIGAKLEPNCISHSPAVCTTEQEIALVKAWISAGAPGP